MDRRGDVSSSDDEDEDVLKIGDVVYFETRSGSKLEASGILDDFIGATQRPLKFEDCLFKICVQTRVSGAEELDVYFKEMEQQMRGGASSKAAQQQMREFLETLKRVAAKEHAMNERLMAQQLGNPVHYGDTIQLQHLRSGKALTVSPEEVAKEEPENLKVRTLAPPSRPALRVSLPSLLYLT
jgi:hypothetical protein